MKKCLFFALLLASTGAFSSQILLKQQLVETINQIDNTIALAQQAQKLQLPNARFQFHFNQWHDRNGQVYNGLIDDLEQVKAGIVRYLQPSTATLSPNIQPISGDYIGENNGH